MKKYFISIFIFFFIFITQANASMGLENPVLKLNNELTITTTQFHTHPAGSITLDLNAETFIYADSGDYNGQDTLYFRYTMCADSTGSAGWSNTSWVKNVKFEHTNISCKFYNGAQGHVMFVNYQGIPPVDVGSGNTNYWIVKFNNSVGAAFWNSVSLQLITIEVDTQGFNNNLIDQQMINQQQEIINQNQTQINQNQTIIDQNQTQISQNQAIWDQNNAIWSEQNKQNQKLDELNDNLTNSDAPDGMDSLSSASGWLPPGPVDSLLTLPLSMLNNISTSLGSTCKPINLPIPFVDKDLTMPCLNTIYSQISGLGVFLNSIGTIASGFMLYYYFKKLYAYIDNLLSLKNNGEGWGDV